MFNTKQKEGILPTTSNGRQPELMTPQEAITILQALINGAIKGGVFNNANGVVNAQNALIAVTQHLNNLSPTLERYDKKE